MQSMCLVQLIWKLHVARLGYELNLCHVITLERPCTWGANHFYSHSRTSWQVMDRHTPISRKKWRNNEQMKKISFKSPECMQQQTIHGFAFQSIHLFVIHVPERKQVFKLWTHLARRTNKSIYVCFHSKRWSYKCSMTHCLWSHSIVSSDSWNCSFIISERDCESCSIWSQCNAMIGGFNV